MKTRASGAWREQQRCGTVECSDLEDQTSAVVRLRGRRGRTVPGDPGSGAGTKSNPNQPLAPRSRDTGLTSKPPRLSPSASRVKPERATSARKPRRRVDLANAARADNQYRPSTPKRSGTRLGRSKSGAPKRTNDGAIWSDRCKRGLRLAQRTWSGRGRDGAGRAQAPGPI